MSTASEQRLGDIAEALLNYVETHQTFQGEGVMTVPATSYLDPELLRSERELLFKRLPLMLALSCELPDPGDYKAMDAMDTPVLLTRDRKGVVRAFLNVCAHRWAPVAERGYGKCNRFTCPFHGWTYSNDGRLIGIADEPKFGVIEKATHGLAELPCEERTGMVFVCLTPRTPLEIDTYYGGLLEELGAFGMQGWHFLSARALEGPNWKLILANFLESYHFATQHPTTVALSFVSNVNHFEEFGPHMRVGFAERSITQLRQVARSDWGGHEGRGFTFMRYLFPNVIVSLRPSGISMVMQLFPGSTPEQSHVTVFYFCERSPKGDAERIEMKNTIDAINQASDRTLLGEDFATGFATQLALRSGAHRGVIYGRNERGSQYLHEWISWYLKDDANAPRPQL